MPRLAHRERYSFSQIDEVLPIPNLLDIQTLSYRWFIDHVLAKFYKISHRSKISQANYALNSQITFFDPPKYTEEECRERDMTYARPLFVTARFLNAGTGEIKEQTVFMGDFPTMTARGTFIVNGTERIVVSQLIRSPGVYFGMTTDKTNPDNVVFDAKIIPGRGAWLEFEIDKRGVAHVRVDRKRKTPVTIFLKALGFGETNEEIAKLFVDPVTKEPYEVITNTWLKIQQQLKTKHF